MNLKKFINSCILVFVLAGSFSTLYLNDNFSESNQSASGAIVNGDEQHPNPIIKS
ncbi:hypothetical protein [Virgibacillus senegalensis]|uniref:hypothetical protein n=1 Tax=Virgibacillus senegalensis TaxID=1499679 RepID=UPI000A729528|nr:hypothetical protein [Virgibacillus senegalensis]